MRNIYDNSEFFAAYAEIGRSKDGLKAAGEWHQLQPLFPKLQGKKGPASVHVGGDRRGSVLGHGGGHQPPQ